MSSRTALPPIGRRAFLKAGGFATLGVVAGAFQPSTLFAASGAVAATGPLLSVGYTPIPTESSPSPRLVPANTLLSGDPAFISRSASVSISAFSRAARRRGLPGGVAVDAIFPAFSYTPEKYPRFQAWNFVGREAGDSSSAPLRFTITVPASQGVQFVVRRIGQNAGDETPVVLALDSNSDSIKLQRGVYVFAFRETPADEMLSWGTYRVSEKNGSMIVNASTFSWVTLVVDYAK